MTKKLFWNVLLCVMVSVVSGTVYAQDDVQAFRNFQLSSTRVSQAWTKYNDTLHKEFARKGIAYPPKDIYLRTFKSQNEMELWARNDDTSEYTFIKLYHICALSGILGPKRFEGDRQVPEGFYFIEEFNPKSDFYLSLLLNYPNYSDMVLGDKKKPGGDIYIHGGCVTVGCMPMTDDIIQQLYILCLNAKLNGETYIPVHIYPVRFNKVGIGFLEKAYAGETIKQKFWQDLKTQYDYFEAHHKLAPIMYGADGRYIVND